MLVTCVVCLSQWRLGPRSVSVQGDQQRLALGQEALAKACQEAKEAQSVAASERHRSACPCPYTLAAHPAWRHLNSCICNLAALTLDQ